MPILPRMSKIEFLGLSYRVDIGPFRAYGSVFMHQRFFLDNLVVIILKRS